MRKNTLKHLELDLYDTVYMDYLQETDALESYASIKALETIRLCNVGIYPVVSNRDPPTNGRKLTGLLPRSIRKVSVFQPHEDLMRDFEHLAAVAGESFPKLEEVSVQTVSDGMWDALEAAFRQVGVRCVRMPDFGA